MPIYIRAHRGSFTFEELTTHTSLDGGDGVGDQGGVCACDSVASLLSNTVMSALEDTDEVIVFRGYPVCAIYDGWRVVPTAEVARFTVADLRARFDEIDELLYA